MVSNSNEKHWVDLNENDWRQMLAPIQLPVNHQTRENMAVLLSGFSEGAKYVADEIDPQREIVPTFSLKEDPAIISKTHVGTLSDEGARTIFLSTPYVIDQAKHRTDDRIVRTHSDTIAFRGRRFDRFVLDGGEEFQHNFDDARGHASMTPFDAFKMPDTLVEYDSRLIELRGLYRQLEIAKARGMHESIEVIQARIDNAERQREELRNAVRLQNTATLRTICEGDFIIADQGVITTPDTPIEIPSGMTHPNANHQVS